LSSECQFGYGSTLRQSNTATIAFEQPNRIRIETYDSNSAPVKLVSDGSNAWVSFTQGSQRQWRARANVSDAMLELKGVTLDITTTLPSILLQTNWNVDSFFFPKGQLLHAFATSARLDGTTFVDAHECYQVTCERSIATWTFYVDTENYLIRRVDESSSLSQFAAQRANGGGGYSGTLTQSHISQVFEIQSIDASVDPNLFQP